jgi:hypothetical protein
MNNSLNAENKKAYKNKNKILIILIWRTCPNYKLQHKVQILHPRQHKENNKGSYCTIWGELLLWRGAQQDRHKKQTVQHRRWTLFPCPSMSSLHAMKSLVYSWISKEHFKCEINVADATWRMAWPPFCREGNPALQIFKKFEVSC